MFEDFAHFRGRLAIARCYQRRIAHRQVDPVPKGIGGRSRSSPLSHGVSSIFALTLVLMGLSVEAMGQNRRGLLGQHLMRRGADAQQAYHMLPTPPRELQRGLVKAGEAFNEGRYADGIELLDRLLADPESGDFFLSDDNNGVTTRSFRAEVQRMLADMPAAAREQYELQYGKDARRRLESALDPLDFDTIRDVSRRYLGTAAGQEATLLLARYHLDRHEPAIAAMHLRRLESLPHARSRLEPELSLLTAYTFKSMGQDERARLALEGLVESTSNSEFTVRGTNYRLPLSSQDVTDLLQSTIDGHSTPAARIAQWITPQGDGKRDRQCAGGMPLPHSEWYVANSLLESESQLLADFQKRFLQQEQVALATTQPLVTSGYMLMRTPNLNMGIHLDTGLQRWIFPFETALFTSDGDESSVGLAAAPAILQERTWDDLVHSQVSCDERHLYFTIGDSQRVAMDPSQVHLWQRGIPGEMEFPTLRNQLVALELATEGKIVWAIGGDDGEEPRLSEAYFLGPPLAVQGELFVIAEMKDELRLLALDPATGKLRWSQQLVHFESPFSVAFDDCRRLGGAVPTFADGVLICPTAAEVVVAVDPASRSLLWAAPYQRNARSNDHLMNTGVIFPMFRMPPPGQRWADSFAMAAGDRVLVTPLEADQLICSDRLTGELKWQVPRERGLFLGGTFENIVAVVEPRHIRSYRLDSGAEAWPRIELPAGGMPSGRGFVNGQFLYLPTTAYQLLKIDLLSGTIVEELTTDVVLGNLTCSGSYLISYGADAVRAFYLRDHMRKRLTEALATNPDDPRTLESYANLLVGDGKLREAVDTLKRCRDLQTDDNARRRTTELLGQTMLMALRSDFAEFSDLLPDARLAFEAPTDQRLLLRIEIEGRLKQGDRSAALAALMQLTHHLAANDEMNWDESLRHPEDDDIRLAEPAWIAALLRQIFSEEENGEASDRESLQEQLQREWTKLIDMNTLRALRLAATIAPIEELGWQARIALADVAEQQGDRLLAELQWSHLLDSSPPDSQLQAALALGNMFSSMNDPKRALWAFERARALDESPDATSQELEQKIDAARAQLASEPFTWPRGEVTASEEPQQTDEIGVQHLMFLDWFDATGPTREGWRAAFDVTSHEIILFDDLGQLRGRIPIGKLDPQVTPHIGEGTMLALSNGDQVVFSLGTQLIAVDLLAAEEGNNPRVLWQRDLTDPTVQQVNERVAVAGFMMHQQSNPFLSDPRRLIVRNGTALPSAGPLTSDSLCFVSGNVLECVDALTGQVRWRRRGIQPNATAFGDSQHVFVTSEDQKVVQVFDLTDGRLIGKRAVPPTVRHWARRGRLVVAFDQKLSLFWGPRRNYLSVWDPWTEQTLWSKRFPEGSRGCLVGFDQVAVVDPTGKLQIFNLLDGSTHATAELKLEDRPSELEVLRGSDRYLCMVSRNDVHQHMLQSNRVRLQGPMRGVRQGPFSGLLLALDRTTGAPLWKEPAQIRLFFMPTFQPSELPILPLYRAVQMQVAMPADRAADVEPRVRSSNELLCLDLRTGGIAVQRDPGPAMGQLLLVRGDPARNSADVLTDRRVAVRLALTKTPFKDGGPANVPPLALPADE